MHLIPEWRDFWRFYSTWAVIALGTWNMVPSILQERIPLGINLGVSAVLLASVIIVRLLDQPKIAKGKDRGDE